MKLVIHFIDPFSKYCVLFLYILNSKVPNCINPSNVVNVCCFQVARQLYEPLVMQLIHWFTNNKKFESQDTVAFLEAILVGRKSFLSSLCHVTLFLTSIILLLKQPGTHEELEWPLNYLKERKCLVYLFIF